MGFLGNIAKSMKSSFERRAGSEITKTVTQKVKKEITAEGKCPKCGKEIDKNLRKTLKYCPNCGAKLFVTCKTCKIDYPLGTKFCPKCGKKLKG